MYPSNNDGIGNPSFSFSSTSIKPRASFFNYNNDSPSSSSFQLLSPHCITLEDEMMLTHLLQQENLFFHDHNSTHESSMEKCNGKFVTTDDGDGKKRWRTDRHSKINTARGPRDRRMRLSLDVAKKFFKLQDMLGFDKASNTVEWLLMNSKSGIQQLLPQQLNQRSMGVAASEREVMSGNECMAKPKPCKEKKRKSAHLHSRLAKETREKARARARKRTVEKISKRPCLDQDINHLGPWTIEQPEQQSSHFQFKQGMNGDSSLLMTASWSPYYEHAGILPHEQHQHQHQVSDFQMVGNIWEDESR